MDRRDLVKSVVAAGAGALATSMVSEVRAAATGASMVVYHLSDLDKVQFVLGNIRNHIDGMGGPDKVTIALVVHGPPLKSFRADAGNPPIKSDVGKLKEIGVEFYACIHTMEGMKLTLTDLLPGFAVAEKGGVVKLAELQGQGWIYLRP